MLTLSILVEFANLDSDIQIIMLIARDPKLKYGVASNLRI